jgi:N utilization substance protein A
LSLAIGKKGQNVRLAAKLLGWKIDIKSEEEKRQEVEQQMQALAGAPTTPIEQVTELGEGIIQKLVTAGITTVEGLADMTPEQLEEIPGIGEKTLEKISVAVRHYFGQFEEAEAAAAAEAAAQESGEAEIQNAPAVEDSAEAEAENAAVVMEELEGAQAAAADDENSSGAEAEAATDAASEGVTAAELAVEDVPVAEDRDTLDAETKDTEDEGKQAAKEDGA